MHFTHLTSAALALYVSSLLADAAPIPALDAAISALKARRSEVYTTPSPTPSGTGGSPSGIPSGTGSGTGTGIGTGTGAVAAGPTIWNRPDKPKFEGTIYQFLDMGDATTYQVGGQSGGPITLAAQATKTFDAVTGDKTTGLVGDVVIADNEAGIIAEAIGVVAPNGARGELFNVIACNVDEGKTAADCILVDYDGTSTKTTYSATIKGTVGPVSLGPATQVPENLSAWATNALSISKVTVDGTGSGSGATFTPAPAYGGSPSAGGPSQTPSPSGSGYTPASGSGAGSGSPSPSGSGSPSPSSPSYTPASGAANPSGEVSFSNGNLVPRATHTGSAAFNKRQH